MIDSAWKGNISLQQNLEDFKAKEIDRKMHTLQSIQIRKRKLMGRLKGIQTTYHNGRGHHGLKSLEKIIQLELSTILQQEKLSWHQSSRIVWLLEGDMTLDTTTSKQSKEEEKIRSR